MQGVNQALLPGYYFFFFILSEIDALRKVKGKKKIKYELKCVDIYRKRVSEC